MQIDELFQSWSGTEPEPPIISQTWYGTYQYPMLFNLWGQQYANVYHRMLALGITSQLWKDFGSLACAEFKKGIVFDAGIGRADIARRLLDTCPDTRVVGGDWSIPFLQHAQKNLRGAKYKGRVALCHMDLTQVWPAEWQGSFDGILCNYVAAYMPIQRQKILLQESFRALRENGVLFINFMVRHVEFRDVLKHNTTQELKRSPLTLLRAMSLIPIFTKKVDVARDAGLIESFTPQDFEEAARLVGFRDVSVVGRHLPLTEDKYAVPTYRLVK